MLSPTMQVALNEQINAELYSGYLYYAMKAYFDDLGMSGAAHWMELQAFEEFTHAHKINGYICERGGRVTLTGIEAPPSEWSSPEVVFEEVAKHEAHVSALINKLVDLAIKESDHATNNFLQWFVAEQVEEEASADEVLQKIKLAEASSGGLFMVDRELSQRVFTLPVGFGEGA